METHIGSRTRFRRSGHIHTAVVAAFDVFTHMSMFFSSLLPEWLFRLAPSGIADENLQQVHTRSGAHTDYQIRPGKRCTGKLKFALKGHA